MQQTDITRQLKQHSKARQNNWCAYLVSESESNGTADFYRYDFAGGSLYALTEFNSLEPYFIGIQKGHFSRPEVSEQPIAHPITTRGWIGGSDRTITAYWHNGACMAIDVEKAGLFQIDMKQNLISIPCLKNSIPKAYLEEIVLGPILGLFLTHHDKWLVHASAAEYQGKLALFLGRSGAGKSTLAEWLNSLGTDWKRVADDICVVMSPGAIPYCEKFSHN